MPKLSPVISLKEPDLMASGLTIWPFNFDQVNPPPFTATQFEVAAYHSSPVDQHAVIECWIILQGEGVLEFAGEHYRLQQGDKFYFPSYAKHQVHNDTALPLTILSLYW